jgi:hypothetical protein
MSHEDYVTPTSEKVVSVANTIAINVSGSLAYGNHIVTAPVYSSSSSYDPIHHQLKRLTYAGTQNTPSTDYEGAP